MRMMQQIIGICTEGIEKTKRIWKLRQEKTELFLWLTHMTFLGVKFNILIHRKFVFNEKELREFGKRIDDLCFKLKSDMKGKIKYLGKEDKEK